MRFPLFSSSSHEIDHNVPSRQKFVTGDYVGDPYQYQIWCKSAQWRPQEKCMIYNQNFIYLFTYLYFFGGNSPTGQTGRRIITLTGSNDTDSRNAVPFRGFIDCCPFRESNSLKPLFWGGAVNRRFKSNALNIQTFILSKEIQDGGRFP